MEEEWRNNWCRIVKIIIIIILQFISTKHVRVTTSMPVTKQYHLVLAKRRWFAAARKLTRSSAARNGGPPSGL